jgi:hypothetical protein
VGDLARHVAPGEVERWQPLDLIKLGATPPEPPAIAGLFYLGKRHLVHGLSETGKTWLFLAAAVEELREGRAVVWVDGDLVGASDLLERLRAFGIEDERIRAHFRYFEPDAPLADSTDLVGPLVEGSGRLAVLDGFNPLLHLHNLDPDRGVDIEAFNRHIAKPLRDAGAAVVIGDNETKAKEGRRWAIGSERKKSAVEVQFGLTKIEDFGRGRTGRFKLTIHKDRPGFLRASDKLGLLVLTSDPDDGHCSWRLEPDTSIGEEGGFRPTHLMGRVSRYLELRTEPVSRNEIEDGVTGKRDALRAAIDRLVLEGYAVELSGERGARLYTSSVPYRESDESEGAER